MRWTFDLHCILITLLFYFSSIHYFCGYSFICHNFKMVDSINFRLVAFICLIFFCMCRQCVPSVVRISRLCFFPNVGMKYNLFCLYLSFTKELFPLSPSRPSYCQAGYDSEDVIWKKSTEKKFPLPHQQKPTPLLSVMIYKYLDANSKYTIYSNFEAYLNILFCSNTKENFFLHLKNSLICNWK